MCGIFFCIFNDGQCCNDKIEHLIQAVKPLIKRRGPDDLNTKEKVLFDHGSGQTYKVFLMGAVLHLRGSLTSQPLEDDTGNVLIWNGEVFDGHHVPDDSNDTSVLSHLLGNQSNSASHVLNILSNIQGPWSFVYYQASEGKLWFGRDYFGRRSLVWHLPRDNNDVMAVSSVAQRCNHHTDISWVWEEVPADGIYCLTTNLQDTAENQLVEIFKYNDFKLKKYPWLLESESLEKSHIYTIKAPVKPFSKDLPKEPDLVCLEEGSRDHEQGNGLREKTQCLLLSAHTDINKTRISEGQSSKLVHSDESEKNAQKALTNTACVSPHNFEPIHPPLQLPSGATLNNIDTWKELGLSTRTSKFNTSFMKDNNTATSFGNITYSETLKLMGAEELPEVLISVLGEAVRKRVLNLPRIGFKSKIQLLEHKEQCSTPEELLNEKINFLTEDLRGSGNENFFEKDNLGCARVGILFSGGIDSIVLAALADRFIPKTEAIDLLNVAFEQKVQKHNPTNKRKTKLKQPEKGQTSSFDVPDRVSGRNGVVELNTISPKRQWNFIEVNVNLKQLQEARSKHITHLVSPLNSVLDDSIGCALWFAARGSGVLRCPKCIMQVKGEPTECVHPYEYTSLAKVVLVGMGADEQLGGYARHRTRFSQQGWQGLIDEMEMEVNRISERNLGRDDRCISDHGREARFPFLDEQVVSFLNGLPVWLKADLRLPRGTGEKILLRQAAKLLGLTSSAVLPKRAIQFGSRIAKLEGTSEKGSDSCSRLK